MKTVAKIVTACALLISATHQSSAGEPAVALPWTAINLRNACISTDSRKLIECYAYVSGVRATWQEVVSFKLAGLPKVCQPKDLQVRELAAAAVGYMDSHPNYAETSGATLVLLATIDRYPCANP